MKNSLNDLYEFITRAEKNRKYLPNTATNFRTPLRLVEAELNDDEKESIELIKQRLDQIFHLLFSKNSTLSAASLEVYKRRIRNLIADYEKYGADSAAMANWNREVVVRKSKKLKVNNKEIAVLESKGVETQTILDVIPELGKDMQKFEIPFEDGTKAVIFTPPPHSLNPKKLRQLKGYISYLETSLLDDETAG